MLLNVFCFDSQGANGRCTAGEDELMLTRGSGTVICSKVPFVLTLTVVFEILTG
jgi:hypothetical protein